jgi:hypothetical protein
LFGVRTKSLSPETKPAYAAGHEQGENTGFWRDEALSTLRLAVPLAAANLLQMAVYAIDVIFVARLGQTPLAASSLSVSLFGLLAWSLSGLTGAVSALVAAELGARNHAVRSVRRSTRMGLWLAVGTGILAMILCSFGREIMLMTGQAPEIAQLSGEFLHVLKWAMVPMLIGNVLRSVVSALGRPVFATFITALAIAVNAAGNYALVFGHWGMPALGLGFGSVQRHHRMRDGAGLCRGDFPTGGCGGIICSAISGGPTGSAARDRRHWRADLLSGAGRGGPVWRRRFPDGPYWRGGTGRAYGGLADRGLYVPDPHGHRTGRDDPCRLSLRRGRPGGDGPRGLGLASDRPVHRAVQLIADGAGAAFAAIGLYRR